MAKIIIIGGGIAGLAAGVYARLAGFEADIYEKNPVVGGECMGWNRQGLQLITASIGLPARARIRKCTEYGKHWARWTKTRNTAT